MNDSGRRHGGGVTSAIARAIGANDVDRASTLAAQRADRLCFGLTFMLGMLIFGPALWRCSAAAQCAGSGIRYIQIFFGGAVLPW